MKSLPSAEADCVLHLQNSPIPFHDIFRSLYGLQAKTPTKEEFEQSVMLFENIYNRHAVRVLKAMKKEIALDEAVRSLRGLYSDKKYDVISYGFWLEYEE